MRGTVARPLPLQRLCGATSSRADTGPMSYLGMAGLAGVTVSRARTQAPSPALSTIILRVEHHRLVAAADTRHLRVDVGEGTATPATTRKLVRSGHRLAAAAGLVDATLPGGARWDVLAEIRDALRDGSALGLGAVGQLFEGRTAPLDAAAVRRLDRHRPDPSAPATSGVLAEVASSGTRLVLFHLDVETAAWHVEHRTVRAGESLTVTLGHQPPNQLAAELLPASATDDTVAEVLGQLVEAAAATAPALWGARTVAGPAHIEILHA